MRRLLIATSMLLAFKLLLVGAQPIKAVAPAAFDDGLFINLARQIHLGNWLGEYTNLTLAKGPGAPLFIAVTYALHIPLPIAQHVFYGLACLLAVLCLRPVVRHDAWLIGAFAILLFNPVTYDAGAMTRVSRSHIYASAILVAIASFAALATWRGRSRSDAALTLWITAAGLSAGFAWITREETVMIAPALLVTTVGMAIWVQASGSTRNALGYLTAVAASLALASLIVATIAGINYANYGTFTVTEIRNGPFARAHKALARIPPFNESEQVAMTEEARRTAYEISPTFRELEPYLEGAGGDAWIEQSKFFVHRPTKGRGFIRGWFIWALRDAVADKGYYESPSAAAEFYDRVADEVIAACADPALRCNEPGPTPGPPMTGERISAVLKAWIGVVRYVVSFDEFTALSASSLGTADDVARVSHWTRWPTAPRGEKPRVTARERFLQGIGRAYGVTSPLLTLFSVVIWFTMLAHCIRRRALNPLLVISTSAIALVAACTGVVAIVDVLAFPAINKLYLAPAYPALLLMWVCAAFWIVLRRREREMSEDFLA